MCEVILFPVKKKLPKELEDRLGVIAKEYIEVLYASLNLLSEDEPTVQDYEEVTQLVMETYVEALDKAVENLEKEL